MQCPCAFSPSFPPIYPVASHPMTFHPISFYPIPSHPSVCQVRTFSLAAHATSIEIIQPMSPGKYEEIIVSYETNQVEACIVAPPSTLSSYVNSIEFLPVSGFFRSLSHSFLSSSPLLSFTNPNLVNPSLLLRLTAPCFPPPLCESTFSLPCLPKPSPPSYLLSHLPISPHVYVDHNIVLIPLTRLLPPLL